MVLSVVKNFQQALKYRGGWRGLLEHMYTVSDFLLQIRMVFVFQH
jgi:hypothetical protein